jgi:hypothetical protein
MYDAGGEEEFIHSFGGEDRRKEAIRKTDVGEKIILKWFLQKYDGVAWTGLI